MNRFAVEREFFREHRGEPLDESVLARSAKVEFAVEPWDFAVDDIKRLAQGHWQELSGAEPEVSVDDDWPARYRQCDTHVLTARYDDALVGYVFASIAPHAQCRELKTAYVAAFHLLPAYRIGLTGYRMLKTFRDSLRGVAAKIYIASTLTIDLDPIMQRLGFKPVERVYTATL